jgi:lipoprotein-releasing system ATP-binding protein
MSQVAPQSVPSTAKSERPVILRAQGVKKSYRMGDETLFILKHIDLTLREGEFVAIEGRSGSGKSTLLHILGTLDSPDSGTLEFRGRDYTPRFPSVPTKGATRWPVMATVSDNFLVISVVIAVLAGLEWLCYVLFHALFISIPIPLIVTFVVAVMYFGTKTYFRERPICDLRSAEFGFVFQFYHLLPELNVLENTLMSSMIENSWLGYRRRRAELTARATQVLKDLGLGHRLKHKPSQLSGGERQRVAIARALMNNPKVLFADEPTGNLDVDTGRQIMGVLEKLHRERGQTIVMVTHDRTLASQADRALVLRQGRLERPGETPGADKTGTLDYH